MRFIFIIATLSFSQYALADDKQEEGRKVIYKQKTEIDFEGIELQGQLIKPSGVLLLDRKSASFNPLIKLRKDFDEEMSDSVREIK